MAWASLTDAIVLSWGGPCSSRCLEGRLGALHGAPALALALARGVGLLVPPRVQHHLDAAVLLVIKYVVRLGRVVQRHLVRDDNARLELLFRVDLRRWW